MVISPPSGRETGINSAIAEMIIKNNSGSHISDKSGIVGIKKIKRIIAKNTVKKIYIFNLLFKVSPLNIQQKNNRPAILSYLPFISCATGQQQGHGTN